MWDQVTEWGNDVMRLIGDMNRTSWLVVFAIVVVVGVYCMRGFGSRTNY